MDSEESLPMCDSTPAIRTLAERGCLRWKRQRAMGGGGVCFVGMAGSVGRRMEYHVIDQACAGVPLQFVQSFPFCWLQREYYMDIRAAAVEGRRASMAHP